MDKCDLWNIQLCKAHEPTLIVAVKLKTWVPLTDLYQSLPWGPGGHLLLQWMVSFHMEAIRLQSQWPLTWKQFNTFEWSKNRPLLENYVNERAFKLIFFDIFLFFLCAALETIWNLSRFWTLSLWKLSMLSSQFQLHPVLICSSFLCYFIQNLFTFYLNWFKSLFEANKV